MFSPYLGTLRAIQSVLAPQGVECEWGGLHGSRRAAQVHPFTDTPGEIAKSAHFEGKKSWRKRPTTSECCRNATSALRHPLSTSPLGDLSARGIRSCSDTPSPIQGTKTQNRNSGSQFIDCGHKVVVGCDPPHWKVSPVRSMRPFTYTGNEMAESATMPRFY